MTEANLTLTRKHAELLLKTRYAGFPEVEIDLFIETCNRVQLDPLAGQILLDRRYKGGQDAGYVYSPYTQIDGFRVIAQRTEDYAGQLGPFWYDADPEDSRGYENEEQRWWEVWPFYMGKAEEKRHPYAAKVCILRKGFDAPLTSVVRWSAYAQVAGRGDARRLNNIWAQRGDFQLAKCAEALGLRRACPNLLSGLYTAEEIEVIKAAEVEDAEPEELPEFGGGVDEEESALALETWKQNVAGCAQESLADLQADFLEGFAPSLTPLHQAEVLAAISKRLNEEVEPRTAAGSLD